MGNKSCVAKPSVATPVTATRRTRNCVLEGSGGTMKQLGGKVHVCIVAYDYTSAGAWKHHIPSLTCSADGRRFAKLARDSGAEVKEFYDSRKMRRKSAGFPTKETIVKEWCRIGAEMEDDDVFVFFFAGHGFQTATQTASDVKEGRDEAKDEVMLFTDPEGTPVCFQDDEVARVLADHFAPSAHILFVTDCCHCNTMCDLSRKNLKGRPIVHMAAVKDSQSAKDLGDGGAFTCALVETIEKLSSKSAVAGMTSRDISVTDVYNKCFDLYSGRFQNQDFTFEATTGFDADTFRWPLLPPVGWAVKSPLDDLKLLC